MDTSTPIGISEFFRITRHATSHQIRNDAPSSALNGNNLLWSVPKKDSDHMRDHKSYKADHTRTIYCKPNHYRSNDQIKKFSACANQFPV